MNPEYPQAPTEGNEAAPQIFPKPQNISVKIPPIINTEYPNQYYPQQPNNYNINVNQSNQELLIKQNDAINKLLEQQNKMREDFEKQKIETLQKEINDLKQKQIL